MKKKILIATSPFERAHFLPFLDEWLAASPHECRFHDSEDAAGFLTTLETFSPDILVGAWDMPALPLSAVKSQGGSVEYFCFIPGSAKKQITAAHLKAGLVFTNWGTWIGPYVAECALLLTLGALRRVGLWGQQLKANGIWRERLTNNHSLFRKRVGLHGFGSIAQSLVELMRPFDPIVTADTGVPDAILERHGVKRAESTEALFAESDVLIELKPLNARNLQVGLDVFAVEPLPVDSPLRSMPNVFMLPHMGGATIDRGIYCGQRALQNVENHIAGLPLDNQVTVKEFERAT